MNQAGLVHPLVAGYLRQFDAAASMLPVPRARELREQVVAHIEEAVGPDAGDEEVATVLRGLDPASLLVAEAVATAGKRSWAARVGWRGWTLVAALVLVVAAVSGYYVRIDSIGPLFVEGSYGWWYQPDYTRQVTTRADLATQTTVPIRPGQRQGFFIQVFNFTAMTQTVIGSNLGGFGPNGGTGARVRLSASDPQRSGDEPHAIAYSLPVSIPPGQSRYLRITWVSHGCPGHQQISGMDSVELRVRVGWTTRTEYLQFGEHLLPVLRRILRPVTHARRESSRARQPPAPRDMRGLAGRSRRRGWAGAHAGCPVTIRGHLAPHPDREGSLAGARQPRNRSQ
jgi:hypothetical protein